jgi:hypothetical protein
MLDNQITNLTYIDAWSRWLNGESVSNFFLWNIQILWLGRIGKLVSFLSAFAIIVEIVGPTRLREFGASLHDRVILQKTLESAKKKLAVLSFIPRLFTSKTNHEFDEVFEGFFLKKPSGWISMILAYAGAGLTFYKIYYSKGFWPALGYSVLILAIGVYLAPVIVVLLLASPMIALMAIDYIAIEPLAWVLERESLDKIIKFVSLILLLVGFHFDLLAS